MHNNHPFCRFLAPLSDTPYFVVKTANREAEGQHVSTTAIVIRAYDQPFDSLWIALKVDTWLCLEIVWAVSSNPILPILTHLVWSGLVWSGLVGLVLYGMICSETCLFLSVQLEVNERMNQ